MWSGRVCPRPCPARADPQPVPPAMPALPLTRLLLFPCSNPKVQIEAIEGGALQKLLVILATEQPLPVKKKVSRWGCPC